MQFKSFTRKLILAPALLLVSSMVFCNLPNQGGQTTATMNVTQAYQTVEARLTQSASQTPEETDLPTITPTSPANPSNTPDQTTPPSGTTPPSTAAPTSQSCDKAAAGNPIDVTVPDDTQMQPEQSFTKTWRLENVGSCTWTSNYAVTFFSGEQMGAPAAVPLRGEVQPGQSVDISVDMVAPKQAGKYQGNWKLRNASNVLFGIGPGASSPFWVRINVVNTPTVSPTAGTPTATPTPTITPPAVHASGSISLNVGDRIDLDTLGVNSGSGEDLSYESNADGRHPLVPLEGVRIGRYGENQPTLELCQQASLAAEPIVIEDLSIGSYLCYRTDQGLPGYARLTSVNIDNFQLNLSLLTWSLP
ncbi:MAG: NBR1-Ig-like domain-containing protein [Anaerolineales bacterium]